MSIPRKFVIAVGAIATACSTVPSIDVPVEVATARIQVESLLARHGFTCAGHPIDASVEVIGGMDTLFSAEQIVRLRKCAFAESASGYQIDAKGNIVFLFRDENHRRQGYAHLAGLTPEGELWANESYVSANDSGFTKLPSNKTIKGGPRKARASTRV